MLMKLLLVVCLSAVVLIQPASHILKHAVSSESRFDAWKAHSLLATSLRPQESIFVTHDNFLPSAIEYFQDTYRGNTEHMAHVVFHHLVGGPKLEQKAIQAFLCFIARHGQRGIVWALVKAAMAYDDREVGKTEVRLGFYRQIAIEFHYSEVLYEFHDGVFLRGIVKRVREVRGADGTKLDRLLFVDGDKGADCG